MKIALYSMSDYYVPDVEPNVPSGVCVYTRGLAGALTERGHDVTVLANKWSWAPENLPTDYVIDDTKVHILSPDQNLWAKAESVHAWLTSNPHDVVEAHHALHGLIVEQLIGGTPTVVRHASDFLDCAVGGAFRFWGNPERGFQSARQAEWSQHLTEMLMIKSADMVLAAGQKQFIKARQLGCTHVREIPLGINYVDDPVWGDSERDGIFISVSRMLDPRKGGEFLKPLISNIPEGIKVTALAECSDEDVAMIKASIPRDFTFLNVPITDDELVHLYRSSWATIVPTKSESFGMVLLEPLAYGSVVFAWDLADPSKQEWPLWSMGNFLDAERSCTKLPQMIELAKETKAGDREKLRDFAATLLWPNLVEKYEAAYNQAIVNAIKRGRVRGL